MLRCFSCVWLFANQWTTACHAPLSRRFPRQEYWRRVPLSPPRDIRDPGISPVSSAVAGKFFTTNATWEAPRFSTGAWTYFLPTPSYLHDYIWLFLGSSRLSTLFLSSNQVPFPWNLQLAFSLDQYFEKSQLSLLENYLKYLKRIPQDSNFIKEFNKSEM